jgi:hypothetical protein
LAAGSEGVEFIMSTTTTPGARRFAFLPALTAALLSIVGHLSAGEVSHGSAPESATCRLNIRGSGVEAVTLVDENYNRQQFQHPGAHVSLPPGRYHVEEIKLQSGLECHVYPFSDDVWFTLSPDKPHDLPLGAPLKPEVAVTRQGRIVMLNYKLRGVGGYEYVSSNRNRPPQFTVYRGERMVGSDDFQYG